MKKSLLCLCVLALVLGMTACKKDTTEQAELVLVTDAKSVDDKGFNEYSWKGVEQYAKETGKTYKYYMPTEQTTEQYLAQMATAAKGGAKVIVCPGYLFGDAVAQAQDMYPDIKFVCIDFTPEPCKSNSLGVVFEEEESGFLAGYAAVYEGFRKLGFDGALAVPAVKNFGYGFIAGAEEAAQELGLNKGDVVINYSYTGEFAEKPEYVAADKALFAAGTEVIFGCGSPRNSFQAADEFNKSAEKKVYAIGVDSDCSDQSQWVLTSAMKNLTPVVYSILKDIYTDKFVGGQTSIYNINDGASALPMETSQFKNFTKELYEQLVEALKTHEDFRLALPTGYGNGNKNDFVNCIDYAKTVKLVHVIITSDADKKAYDNFAD